MSKNPSFKFIISTPQGTAFEGQILSVALSTEGGEIQCFAHHASLTASVAFSPVQIETEEGKELYMVRNGMFLFDNKTGNASLLTLSAEKKSEMSLETVKEYHDFIIAKLKEGKDLSEFQIKYLEGEKLAVEQQLSMNP